MTEDIFFCYNAKEAPEKDKEKTAVKREKENEKLHLQLNAFCRQEKSKASA